MKNRFIYFILLILFFPACNKITALKSFDTESSPDIRNITIYYMKDSWCLELDVPPAESAYQNLISEEQIRSDYEYIVNISGNTEKANRFLKILNSAKEINVIDNKVRIFNFNGVQYFWQSGVVIDIFYNNGAKDKDVVIMQNGKKVFVKKGEENIYYKMPWQILHRNLWE